MPYKILYLPTAQEIPLDSSTGLSYAELYSFINSPCTRFYNSPSSRIVSWTNLSYDFRGRIGGEIPKHLLEIIEVK